MKQFGWEIVDPRKKTDTTRLKALVPKSDDIGTLAVGSYSSMYSYDQSYAYRDDNELINKYRDMSLVPEVDMAIDEVVNEMVITSENKPVATLKLDDFPASTEFKDKIKNEFATITSLLEFQNYAYDYARRWYIDGRLAFHIMIDSENPKLGIQDIRQLDPCTIRKITKVEKATDPNNISIIKDVKEFYLYNEQGVFSGLSNNSVQIAPDTIAYSSSGIVDPKTGSTLSHLHKALKIANQLAMIESALIIYRLSRAPERRVFYVDTGDLPRPKAEEYLKEQIARHRNKMVYDPTTGELVDKKNVMSMMEDYWLPRRGGTRATEIQTLEGGNNLSNLEDVQYFKEKLYHSLNVPLTRLQPDSTTGFSKDAVIVREELKFARFIDKLRKRFSIFLYDLLKKQLILKCIISPSDWPRIKDYIFIDYQRDSYFSELKDTELLSNKLDLLGNANNFLGTFFSKEYIWKTILNLSDDEIAKEKERIQLEKEEEAENSSTENTDMGLDTGMDTGGFDYENPESNENPITTSPEIESPNQTNPPTPI